MRLSTLDLVVLGVYFVGLIWAGFFFARRNVDTEHYFLGGRRFGAWVIGLSLVGTSISSVTFLAYPADAYKTAWLRYIPNFALPIAVLCASMYFLTVFRRLKVTTAYEYLEHRYGASVRVYGALAFVLAQLVRLATILYLLSLLVQQVTGLGDVASVFLAGGLVAVYTVVGGIEAVIWTDVVQTIVLLLGGVLCLWVIIDMLPGGLRQIMDVANASQKLSFAEFVDGQPRSTGWHLSLSEKTITMMFLLGLTNWLTEYASNQNVVQRYAAANSEATARRAMWICVGASLPIWAFYMFLGTALFVFYQTFPSVEAAAMLQGEAKPEGILPLFIVEQLPVGITGLVVAAALAAAMSSLDSSINSIATVSVVDIYRRHWRPHETDAHYLARAKLFASLASVFMVLGALYLLEAETRTLQHLITILVSLLGGGMLALFGYGFVARRGRSQAAWMGIGFTIAFTAWTVLSQRGVLPTAWQVPFDVYYTAIIANLVMLGGLLLGAAVFRAQG